MVAMALCAFVPASGAVGASTAPAPGGPTVDAGALPSGGKLAFVSAGSLYVVDGASRSVRRVTTGEPVPESPAFSHDGRWLAFLRPLSPGGASTLWMAHGNGSSPRPVGGIPAAVAVPDSGQPVFTWSPTRDALLVTTGPLRDAPEVPRQVWVVTASGRARRLLGPGFVNGVAWSPNGSEVAAIWSASGLSTETLESLPVGGGRATSWMPPNAQASYYLAGWSHELGIALWENAGGGGPSVENYGLPFGVIARPAAPFTTLATVPVFQPPAVAIEQGHVVVVANGSSNGGQGEGEKFVWFGKTVEVCGPGEATCAPAGGGPGTVTSEPAISPNGAVAFVEAAQSDADLPPEYSSEASWAQISAWYATGALWSVPPGSTSPTEWNDTAGAVDPAFTARGDGLLFVKGQTIWYDSGPSSQPVAVAGPLDLPPGPYVFGYVDWPDQFAVGA